MGAIHGCALISALQAALRFRFASLLLLHLSSFSKREILSCMENGGPLMLKCLVKPSYFESIVNVDFLNNAKHARGFFDQITVRITALHRSVNKHFLRR
mmetsp:Transcript_27091/g.42069  ORF Transcript_27091/g.42069 Transcript_27091/m.42069 type:complete len:99 (+) Transcript_27091:1145-1441(+)